MRRRLISEEYAAIGERRSYDCLGRLMSNATHSQRMICFYTVLFSLIIVLIVVFATSYNAYYTSERKYSTLYIPQTTIKPTTKFIDSKVHSYIKFGNNFNLDNSTDGLATTSSIDSRKETSPTGGLLTGNATRINHIKRNYSSSVNLSSEVELITKPARVVNYNSFVTAHHDSSTQSVKYKTTKQKVDSGLTNKFEDKSVESPQPNLRTRKMLMKALKTNEVYPSVAKVKK